MAFSCRSFLTWEVLAPLGPETGVLVQIRTEVAAVASVPPAAS